MYEPDIGISFWFMLFLWTVFPFTQLLPKPWYQRTINYIFPKGIFVLYTGQWLRLDDEELPEWIKKKIWADITEPSPV
jgi:hypothetical protein